jgi:hypothetical protein
VITVAAIQDTPFHFQVILSIVWVVPTDGLFGKLLGIFYVSSAFKNSEFVSFKNK